MEKDPAASRELQWVFFLGNNKRNFEPYMAIILNLETATTNCSVGVAKNGTLLAFKEHDTPNYSHSEQLHVFIAHVLEEAKLTLADINAVAVSKGPGSYTGLRIGVSAAKGLCFALDVPMISIPTLQSLAHRAPKAKFDFIIPVLDARRMEVYSSVYDAHFNEIRETRAEIINEDSFGEYTQKESVLLIGSGAQKCRSLFSDSHIGFDENAVPSVAQMAKLSFEKFKKQLFENVAYFEPYYLKDFMLQSKKG